MLAFGPLELGRVPRIAAPCSDGELETCRDEVRRYADVVELRIDRFARHDPAYVAGVCRAARTLELPLLATVRAAAEGGAVELAEAARLALYESLLPLVDAVDVELRAPICQAVLDHAANAGVPAIVSHHDFLCTPPDAELAALAVAAEVTGAAIFKLAAHAASLADVERLLDFLRARRDRGLIVIGMGDYGIATRVFFPLLGSLLAYGFAGAAMAPGQLPLADLHAALRLYSPEFAAARSGA